MTERLSTKELAALRERLRRHGHARFPALRTEIDDLTAQAIGDLWEYLKGRDAATTFDDETVRKIAYAIFDRRAADSYRRLVPDRNADIGPDSLVELQSGTDDPLTTVLYRKMLSVCVAELSNLAEADQRILAVLTGITSRRDDALNPAERQRLHRLRKRLATAIHRQLGEDAYNLLRKDI